MQEDGASPQRNGGVGARSPQVAPIYARLPHGPHRMDRGEVLHHQRARLHGAMIEAVARNGYAGTSIKQVIGLAGVSRRAFYEQFANREACFLATFDLVAGRAIQRIRRAYLALDASPEDRLRAAFEECARAVSEDPNAAAVVRVASLAAGRAGVARLRSATTTCEGLLAMSLRGPAPRGPLPTPIVRAIAGGLQGALCGSLRGAPASAPPPERLGHLLLSWTAPFVGAVQPEMVERMSANIAWRLGEVPGAGADARAEAGALPVVGATARGPACGPEDERGRILRAALRLAALGDYLELTRPQIAEEADVPPETLNELFADTGECYQAALEMLSGQLLEIVADPELRGADWPRAVRRTLAALLRHLAENPLHAHTIGHAAFAAGPAAAERNLALARAVAAALTAAPSAGAVSEPAVEAVAGAIWHTVGCQAVGGRIQLLPVLSDYLAFVVLTPAIGAERAAEIVTEAPSLSGASS